MTAAIPAAVIGAGAIGARLDRPGTDAPLTHAGGFQAAGFALAGLVDSNADARAAATAWGCPIYSDTDEMMRAAPPAVVSLAVPTAVRAGLLRRLLEYRPRLVVAEKPLTATVTESEDIVRRYEAAGIPLLVNYSRRFIPAWRRLRGVEAISTAIRYAKGMSHNGTHALDLCRMLFGECLSATPLSARHDHWSSDPTVSAFLRFERCSEVFLQGLDERRFTLFEVDIIGDAWRIVVDSDGRRLRRFDLRDGAGTPPGKRLVETDEEDTGAAFAMLNLMRHAAAVLDGAAPWCSGRDALAALRIAGQLAA